MRDFQLVYILHLVTETGNAWNWPREDGYHERQRKGSEGAAIYTDIRPPRDTIMKNTTSKR